MASNKLKDNFGWVELWVKEQNFIKEVKAIEVQMAEICNAPCSPEDVRAEITRFRQKISGIDTLRGIFERFLKGELASFDVETFHAYSLADNDIEAALKNLPEGMTKHEKKTRLASLQAEIIEIRQRIKSECWQDSRKGGPLGDRWLAFIVGWASHSRQFGVPVDFHSRPLEIGSPLHEVFVRLGLNKISQSGFFQPLTLTCPAPEESPNG